MKPRFIAGLEPTISGAIIRDSCARSGRGDNRDFVFQSDNLLPWRTDFSIAIIGPEVAGRLSDKKRQRTLDLLKLMGLDGFENCNPRQLSGGMRQRVNLALACYRSRASADERAIFVARYADARDHAG